MTHQAEQIARYVEADASTDPVAFGFLADRVAELARLVGDLAVYVAALTPDSPCES